jgi:hypothetical protein
MRNTNATNNEEGKDMRILKTTTTADDNQIIARTEYGYEMTLYIVGQDGNGHYAVHWDDGNKWMAGQFVDDEDGGELYDAVPNTSAFECEDATELVATPQQDGGVAWA